MPVDIDNAVRLLQTPQLDRAIKNLETQKALGVVISGKKGSGKDSIGTALMSELLKRPQFRSKEFVQTSYAANLRQELAVMLSTLRTAHSKSSAEKLLVLTQYITQEQASIVVNKFYDAANATPPTVDPYVRSELSTELLQFWGTDIRRNQDPNYWVMKVLLEAAANLDKGVSFLITDGRFFNEVEIPRQFGFKIIRLEISPETQKDRLKCRDGIGVTPGHLNHVSETALDDYPYFDVIFDNSADSTPQIVAQKIAQNFLPQHKMRI
jgi:hypothetical protein